MSLFMGTITGRAGGNADLKYVSVKDETIAVVNFSLAVSPNGKNGETYWYRITAWGAFAEKVVSLVKKGDLITVGFDQPPKVEAYINKAGEPAATINVTISRIVLASRSENNDNEGTYSRPNKPYAESAPQETGGLDDIPF